MPLADQKPRGLLRLGFRLPIFLYRLGLGWLLGARFLLLEHTGRKSGLTRQTVIEVVGHDLNTNIYYVCSGFGRKSDWFLNIQHKPQVKVTVGRDSHFARADVIEEAKAMSVLMNYAAQHPLAFKELSALLVGKPIEPNENNLRHFVQAMPVVSFTP